MSDLEDQRAVLRVLAEASFPMPRKAIEHAAFGVTRHMVNRTVDALWALQKQGFIKDAYRPETGQFHRCYEATERGRQHVDEVEVFHPSGGRPA